MHEQDAFVQSVATKLSERGWASTATAVLEVGRPLAFLGGQALWVAQPALSLFFDQETIRQFAQLLEDPTAVEALVQQLTQQEMTTNR
ncbi:MAG: hypothetical protein KDD89_03650 [Anaerolineales bacterium]|nr:hypothetical protein [Anaerolineales bacterium]